MKRIFAIYLFVLLSTLACSKKTGDVSGTWISPDKSLSLEFKADNTVVVSPVAPAVGRVDVFTYALSGSDKIIFTASNGNTGACTIQATKDKIAFSAKDEKCPFNRTIKDNKVVLIDNVFSRMK